MMYERAVLESTGLFGVLQHIFCSPGGQKWRGGGAAGRGGSWATKSRTICTFSAVEKVRAMRQLRGRLLLLMAADSRRRRATYYSREASRAAAAAAARITDTSHSDGGDAPM